MATAEKVTVLEEQVVLEEREVVRVEFSVAEVAVLVRVLGDLKGDASFHIFDELEEVVSYEEASERYAFDHERLLVEPV